MNNTLRQPTPAYPQGDPSLSGDARGSLLVVFLLGCAAGGGLALTLGILILRATV